MDKYDVIVIGSGAGLIVAQRAVFEGLRVALVEHGPLGGTCLNTGCIPSKMLIHPADIVRVIEDGGRLGIKAHVDSIDFEFIMKRMRDLIETERGEMEKAIGEEELLHWYRSTGVFVGDHVIRVGDDEITAPWIVIGAGARTLVPPVAGLSEAGYLDNVSVFSLERPPESLIILGGGYIACEFGHFFSAMGTDVTIVGRNPRLLKSEDHEISDMALRALSRHMRIHTNMEAIRVDLEDGKKVVTAIDRSGGETLSFRGDEILLAAGRRPNTDMLHPEKTGVEMDRAGWIRVNEHLETTAPGIWALGDVIGKHMFRHTANYEASIVAHNLISAARGEKEKAKVDYHAVPHAIFTYPQIAGVGMTEEQARASGYDILVGRARYKQTAMGYAMDEDGMAKAIVDARSGRILGFHVIGSSAPELVQQVTYLMNAENQDVTPMARSQVIHPAISEVVARAFGNLQGS
ncbi:MAG: dihydrolipoyl dehydrogenase [Methanothrix sp.]|uniref:dihydrolipoyl dehydrogenase n=1 Tax=Methanothrix sp. TaxID=90426 RepID=UPI00317F709C|nr:dihydrolipoyl dehydrogenase [Methanothrix sp.]